jgi:hypothetical protein
MERWMMTKYVAGMYNIYVEDFMVREVRYIWHGITFGQLKDILKDNRNLRSFPLVDSPGIYSQAHTRFCYSYIAFRKSVTI